jgi:hypothetical protein
MEQRHLPGLPEELKKLGAIEHITFPAIGREPAFTQGVFDIEPLLNVGHNTP